MTTEMGLMLVVGIILFGVLEITIQKGSCCTQSRLNLQWPAAVCQLSYNLSLGIQYDDVDILPSSSLLNKSYPEFYGYHTLS